MRSLYLEVFFRNFRGSTESCFCTALVAVWDRETVGVSSGSYFFIDAGSEITPPLHMTSCPPIAMQCVEIL